MTKAIWVLWDKMGNFFPEIQILDFPVLFQLFIDKPIQRANWFRSQFFSNSIITYSMYWAKNVMVLKIQKNCFFCATTGILCYYFWIYCHDFLDIGSRKLYCKELTINFSSKYSFASLSSSQTQRSLSWGQMYISFYLWTPRWQ